MPPFSEDSGWLTIFGIQTNVLSNSLHSIVYACLLLSGIFTKSAYCPQQSWVLTLPTPRGWKAESTLSLLGSKPALIAGKAKYGPVWKASFGPILTVHVADPSLIEQVLRQEGKHPIRSDLSSWKDYRVCRGHAYGLLTAEGEEWQQIRSILGKHMLKPKEVESYTGTLNEVVSDLIGRLQHQRISMSDTWSRMWPMNSTSISSVLFESRIGCLEPKVPEETEKFISSINTMFIMTLLTMAMPKFLHQIFPKPWQKFCESWDYMFEFGECLHTLSWSLYELSRHPQIQAAVHEEITSVMQEGLIPTSADVAQMPLLKAVVKEVLRLYPVIPGNARVISDRDIQVGDYMIPKKTLITLCHYATSRDETYFSDPNSFQPERWLHKNASHHPYASIPFGFGKRSCIGRRIAELEVYLALARVRFTEDDVFPDNPMTRTLLVPEKDINLQFLSR
uniref:Cytochrome P450 family 27 subfamily B member 1 n=1 Tax=Naja naja TaxID=35670 RepID=A0A8C6XA76_NAJNA